jgi:hypothetical protein
MVRVGVVFAEPSVDESMVRGLVVDPQKEELSWLEIGLELEGDRFKGNSVKREGFRFGRDCSRGRAHLALTIAYRAFIDEQCCCWYCFIRLGAWTCLAGSHILSLLGYPIHLTKY